MSIHSKVTRITAPAITARKGGEKLVCLTAYTAPIAEILDEHADLLLVGDSLGMVVHGLPSTVGVTLDMMIMHGKAVARGAQRAMIVVDLPFGTYEASPRQAHESAARIMAETGCQAVKVEACDGIPEIIEFLVGRGIPVLGHVGLRPQAVNVDGGFRAKGRTESERERVLAEARAVEAAGAFATVVEGVDAEIAPELTASIRIPTIGIGASADCDGQILVTDDMLGMFDWSPKFVRRYANLREVIGQAAAAYASDIRAGAFPGEAELYRLKRGK